jgi:hypothetical protein
VIDVSTAGMDTGACGVVPRCETIDFAINTRAATGDTVLVQPGTYSTAAAMPITLKSGVSVRGATGNPADVIVTADGMNDVFQSFGPLSGSTISALTIRPGPDPATGTTSNAGILIDSLFDFDVVDAVIENNRFAGGERGIVVFNDDDSGNTNNAVHLAPTIRGNLFTGQFEDGVFFNSEDVSGALKILAPQISSNTFLSPGDDGIQIDCTDSCEGTRAPTIRQNLITSPGADGVDFAVAFASNSAGSPYLDLSPLIDGNTILGAGQAGIDVSWGTNTDDFANALFFFRPTITGNTVTGADAPGIEVSVSDFSDGESMVFVADVAITGNTVSGAVEDGIRLLLSNFSESQTSNALFVQALVADNLVSSNEGRGIALSAVEFEDSLVNAQIAMAFDVAGNMVSDNDLGGIEVVAAEWNDMNAAEVALGATISGNTVTDNGTGDDDHGIHFFVASWQSIATAGHLAPTLIDIRGNTVTGNAGAGIVAQAVGIASDAVGFNLAATIADNVVSGNMSPASGIELRFSDVGAAGIAVLTGNTVTMNEGTALLIELQDDCSGCAGFPGPVGVALRNNTITSGAGDAIRIDAADGTTAGGVLTNITGSATSYQIDLGGGFYNDGSDGKNVIQGFTTPGSGGTCEGGAFCDIVNHGPSDVPAACNELTAGDVGTEEDFLIDDDDATDLGDVDPISICPVPAPAGMSIDVSTAGADTGACGMGGTPCATIAHALTLASDGDTVLVMPGTYNSSAIGLVSGVSVQGSTGDPADVTIVGAGANVFEAFGPLSSSTVVSGLTIDAGACGTATFECDGPIGILLSAVSPFQVLTPVIENNRFEGGCCGVVGANVEDGDGVFLAPTIRENFFSAQESDAIFFIATDSGDLQVMAPEVLSNTMDSPGFDGAFFLLTDSAEGTLAPLVDGNMVTGPDLDGIHFQVTAIENTDGEPFLRFLPLATGNTLSGLDDGCGILARISAIDTSAQNGIVFFEPTITGNTVTGTGAGGDSIDGIAATVSSFGEDEDVDSLVLVGDVTIRDNMVADMGGDGIALRVFDLENMDDGAIILNATISDNDMVADNGSDGIDVELTEWTNDLNDVQIAVQLAVSGNTVSGNEELGIEIELEDWTSMTSAEVAAVATIAGNTVTGNGDSDGDHGIAFEVSDWSNVALFDGGLAPVLVTISDNTVSDNAGAGIVAEALDISSSVVGFQFAPTITGNVITGNMSVASGLEIRYTDNGAAGTAIVTRNQITGNNGTGVLIDLVGPDNPAAGPVNVALRTNTITSNGGDAVKINAFGGASTATNYEIDLGGGFFNGGSDGRNVLQGMSAGATGDCAGGAFCDVNNMGPNDVFAVCNEFTSDDVDTDCDGGTEEDFLNDEQDNSSQGNICPISACTVVCTVDADCDDGLACNGVETCAGVGMMGADLDGCLPGTPVDCDDGAACTFDACAEPSGTCSNTPIPASCNDAVDCTTDTCDPMGIGADADGCVFAPDNGFCTDGVGCTDDVCNPMLGPGTGCASTPNDDNCDDANVCTDETCDTVLDCQTTFNTDPCDDGFTCTNTDTCDGAGMCAGTPDDAVCADGDNCTTDTCDPAAMGAEATTGCVNAFTDGDGDGVCDFIENGAPNGGDGNDDGTADSQQQHVTSLPNVVSGAYMTMITDPSCPHTNVAAVPLDIPDVLLPFGGLTFELLGCPMAKVTVLYHDTDNLAQPPFEYFKKGPNPPGAMNEVAYTLATGAPHFTMFGSLALPFDSMVGMAMFTLTDNVAGDDTGPDGDIIDQGGPGIPIDPAPAPALTPLGYLIALLVLGGVALLALRRSHPHRF